jgi:predicted dehydrogenase
LGSNASPVEAVLIGAGGRGTFAYGAAALAHPDALRFVAVAEPDPERRARFAAQHNLPSARCFASWDELLAVGQLAPALVCCTLDRLHVGPAVAALQTGYHVLLEKPMAVTPEDCVRIVQASERANRLLMICHVLRYTTFFATLHDIVASDRLGDIVTVEHRENVAYWHMAHSFVRGNWSNAGRSSPMILSKCCHDLDILVWMMAGNPVVRLHSFGSLLHFRPAHVPPGAPARCTDGCPAANDCAFYAPRLYLTDDIGWPTAALSVDLSYDARLRALQTGPYGRCVYQVDNDVVDHQVVNMEHRDGAVATLVMHGHSHEEGRTMRYDGTRATLRARFTHHGGPEITLYDHRSGAVEDIPVPAADASGHGGGDSRLLQAFADAVRHTHREGLTSARASLESHLLGFAAERSRTTGAVIDVAAYRAEIEAAARQRPEPAGERTRSWAEVHR